MNADLARRLIRYDPATGKFYWKPRSKADFPSGRSADGWNRRYANKETFARPNAVGYGQASCHGRVYLAHQVAWLIMTGVWPEGEIDHINGKRCDNRWENLRLVSHRENAKNAKRRKDNSSGVTGVSWAKRERRWRARVYISPGREKVLGYFKCIGVAACARAVAIDEHDYHRNHGLR